MSSLTPVPLGEQTRINARLIKARERLAATDKEIERQSEFIGLRLGVFARMCELHRDKRRHERLIESLETALRDAPEATA